MKSTCKNCGRFRLKVGYNICERCWDENAEAPILQMVEDQEITPKGNIIEYTGNPWTGEVKRVTMCPGKYLVVYDDEYLPSRFEIGG